MSCAVGHRCGLNPTSLWLRCRPEAAAPIQRLAWELPYAAGATVKRKKKKKRDNGNIHYFEKIPRTLCFTSFLAFPVPIPWQLMISCMSLQIILIFSNFIEVNHTASSCFCLSSFTQHNYFEIDPCCARPNSFLKTCEPCCVVWTYHHSFNQSPTGIH